MFEDEKLLWRLQQGDKDAFRLLYERHADDLLTLAANLLHDPATADDVVQDVFVSFARSAQQLKLRRTIRAYLATAVANRVRDHYRRNSRGRSVPIEDAGYLVASSDGPVQMVIDTEQMHRLRVAVEELPYEQREVVMLHVHAGLKFREIAKHQNISVKTALSRYRYALDKLRSMMDHEVSK
jgi:RNA polymerase sigma factor (sigma-70 family)